MIRISDYLLPTKILGVLCNKMDCDFVDIEIVFTEEADPIFKDNIFYIPSNLMLPQVFWAIVSLYINNIQLIAKCEISDEDKSSVLIYVLALIRDFSQRDKFTDFGFELRSPIAMRLDQFPVSWLLMKSIICPTKQIGLKNMKIIADYSPYVDAAIYVDEENAEDAGIAKNSLPLIFINLGIESKSILEAFVFCEALRAHDLDVSATIREFFGDYFLQKKLLGFISMAFDDDEDGANFLAVLSLMGHSQELENIVMQFGNNNVDNMKRTAQFQNNQSMGADLEFDLSTGTWWFLGLTEKMLGASRGSDWTAHDLLKTLSDEFWNKVEKVRQERNLTTVPFETLMRIHGDEFKTDGTRTLQGLLADNRIW